MSTVPQAVQQSTSNRFSSFRGVETRVVAILGWRAQEFSIEMEEWHASIRRTNGHDRSDKTCNPEPGPRVQRSGGVRDANARRRRARPSRGRDGGEGRVQGVGRDRAEVGRLHGGGEPDGHARRRGRERHPVSSEICRVIAKLAGHGRMAKDVPGRQAIFPKGICGDARRQSRSLNFGRRGTLSRGHLRVLSEGYEMRMIRGR